MNDRFVVGLDSDGDGRAAARVALDHAVADTDVDPVDATFAVVFASPEYEPGTVARAVSAATDAPLLGCTSAGEFTHRERASGSVGVALSFGDTHRLHTSLGHGVTGDEEAAVRQAITGLGLFIVEEIAEAHDWTVELGESESGGLLVTFHGVERVTADG